MYLAEESVTKRIVLSSIAKVYDPLGLLSPITTVLKILFQAICKDKNITWDDVLEDETAKSWKSALTNMKENSTVDLNRCYSPQIDRKEIRSVELKFRQWEDFQEFYCKEICTAEKKTNDNLVDDARRRERFLTRVLNHFWERWRKEYLTELREQHKVKNGSAAMELMRGRDGNVRAATIRTSSGGRVQQLQRPIQRLYPIEIPTKNQETVPQIKFVRDNVPNAIQNFNT
ncbi:Hypothetical predicted protein [Paramuricea clavata]|uniref:DUF5641 domain-containing protein n=1 Tax=Paramuricea clavata TaxID=317549 RepID=A0A6S7L183_PARCT|nr:Hypothetical predicted protein [Paramuricea clavata]